MVTWTTFDPAAFKIASVRAPPANWNSKSPTDFIHTGSYKFDLDACIELAIQIITKASSEGVSLVNFPEIWFPGYVDTFSDKPGETLLDYFNNTLLVDGPQWKHLMEAIKTAQVYVALSFAERDPSEDKMYMAQSLISPEGATLLHRRKIRPGGDAQSKSERYYFSDGNIADDLKVVQTPYGRMGLSCCYEHSRPYMWGMFAQNEDIHFGPFPYQGDYDQVVGKQWHTSMKNNSSLARVYAINSGAYYFYTAVGLSEVFDSTGDSISFIPASTSYIEQPYLVTTIDTTGFDKSYQQRSGETGWAAIKQLYENWPGEKVENDAHVQTRSAHIHELVKLE